MAVAANHRKTITRLLLVVVGMFGFGYALVPLYDVFCSVTGINGKPNGSAVTYQGIKTDESREVTVEFITRTNNGMSWQFRPMQQRVTVHPGQLQQVDFYAKNVSSNDMIGQAVPSVSPGEAALYLNKTECFCFHQQTLKAGEQRIMPVRFYIDPALPESIRVFTLSYTLYDVSPRVQTGNRG